MGRTFDGSRPANIAEMVPAGARPSAGVFVRYRGRFIFAGCAIPGRNELLCARIGGGCEPGESWLACVHRETQEELGCGVEIVSSPVSYYAGLDIEPHPLRLNEDPCPLLVCLQAYETDPAKRLFNVLFIGSLLGTPRPLGETETIVYLTEEQLIFLPRRGSLTIAQLQDAGAILEPRTKLQPDMRVRFGGAPARLARLLELGLPCPQV